MHPPTSEYFTRFLPGHMHRPLLAGYDGLSAEFAIHFRDLEEHWHLRVEAGRLVQAERQDAPLGRVCFVVDEAVFREIASARLSPQRAFFARRTDIRGDLLLGLRLAKVLGLFFERYPWEGGAAP